MNLKPTGRKPRNLESLAIFNTSAGTGDAWRSYYRWADMDSNGVRAVGGTITDLRKNRDRQQAWRRRSVSVSDHTTSPTLTRCIYHYGTLMMVIRLDAVTGPDGFLVVYDVPVVRPGDPFASIVYMKDDHLSQSDKCGMTRIRSGLLRWGYTFNGKAQS